MKSNIQIRIDTEMKSEFIRICKSQEKTPSKVLRGMIESFVMNNQEVSLQNNICIDDLVNTVTTKSGKTHYYAKVPLEVFKANGKFVCTYKQGKPLKNKYVENNELFKIEEVSE